MTMVERVARALCKHGDDCWRTHMEDARAAIEAMREPNRTMRVAAGEALYLPIEEARRLAEEEKFDEFANDGVIAWLAMISAALSEQEGK